MVLKCSLESSYITSDPIPDYVLISNPTKVEMAASSVYGTLPRAPKCHRRGNSDAAIPAKYATYSTAPKKSFFAGLANKFKLSVDGKSNNQIHKRLQWSPSEEYTSSTGSLHNFPLSDRKQERPQRLWTRGIAQGVYSSQRRLPSWKKSSLRKSPKDTDMGSCSSQDSSSFSSSAPSSPETHRSFVSSNAKRLRRSRGSQKSDENGFTTSRTTLRDSSNRNSISSQISNEELKKTTGCKLLIIGAEGVGKSALTVRFLTKRFIGEYAPEIESVYDQTMNVEGKDMNVHVWDSAIPQIYQNSAEDDVTSDSSFTSSGESCSLSNRFSNSSLEDDTIANNNKPWGQENLPSISRKNKLRRTINKKIRRWRNSEESESEGESNNAITSEAEKRLKWADRIVVVYSICDKPSFEAARDVIRYVRKVEAAEHSQQNSNVDFASVRTPILLVGNKLDLEHRRQVPITEARQTASNYSCTSCELSVSESFEPVNEAIREHLKSNRKSSKSKDSCKSKSKKNKW